MAARIAHPNWRLHRGQDSAPHWWPCGRSGDNQVAGSGDRHTRSRSMQAHAQQPLCRHMAVSCCALPPLPPTYASMYAGMDTSMDTSMCMSMSTSIPKTHEHETSMRARPLRSVNISMKTSMHARPLRSVNISIETSIRARPLRSVVNVRRSRVPMDHYDYPNRDNGAAKLEAGRPGKSTAAPVPGAGPNGIFGVLQQTGAGAPKDRWLDHKGKAKPDGPEVRRGRRDLTETIQQSGNPYQDGRSLGDTWLEAKGKAMPPGPEMRRGRRNLDEIIQQTSNPYQDGRALGDAWLEAKGKAPVAAPAAASTMRATLGRSDGAPEPVVGGKYIAHGIPQKQANIVPDVFMTTRA
eukprot:364297-Chlamydomonas_euryale.AAC.11